MSNPHRGEVSFSADRKTYTLRYSADALTKLENILDKSVLELFEDFKQIEENPMSVRIGFVRALLWGGLQDHHPELDLIAAGELIAPAGGMAVVVTKISEAFVRAFPGAETKDTRPPKGPNRAARRASRSTG